MYKSTRPVSVFDMLKAEEKCPCRHISTFAKGFDRILDGCHFTDE